MMGSETFIIVAFRCSENSTPCAFASSICASTKRDSDFTFITAASTISPACTFTDGLSTCVVPSLPMNSIFSVVASAIVAERSLP